jgi:hypothetical protein
MQNCSVLLSIGGDITKTVHVYKVNPAHALVLMRLHGRESVVRIPGTTDESNEVHSEVIQHLAYTYGSGVVEDVFGKQLYGIKLPTRFSEIQLSIAGENEESAPEPEVATVKRGRKPKAVVDSEPASDDTEPAADSEDPVEA